MKKVLICGSGGQLGSALKYIFSKNQGFEVYGLSRSEKDTKNSFSADITDAEKLKKIFVKLKPEIVINAAGMVNAEHAEKEKEEAFRINCIGNRNLLTLVKECRGLFVFISSYYVFDGEKEKYDEEDMVSPINYYGMNKVISEIETRAYENSLIIRACKIFSLGYDTRNMIARTYDDLKNNREARIICDQFNNPVHADFMAEAIKELIEKDKRGTYNLGGEDYIDNYNFCKRFAEHFRFNSALIKPIKTEEITQLAPRPKKVFLKLDKLKKEGIKTYNLKEMFEYMEKKQ
jgi:dTDP-4-dehydrorhamnose reductase